MTLKTFIAEHRNDDIRQLALQAKKYPDIDMQEALQQIAGWQTAQQKLPTWSRNSEIVYPPHIGMEQCSSEMTARYKADVALRWFRRDCTNRNNEGEKLLLADMTGGFGVDFAFMAETIQKQKDLYTDKCSMLFMEKQQHLCMIAKHNFDALGLKNINVENGDSTTMTGNIDNVCIIFADPARRDSNGGRTYAISDCTPDISALQDTLLEKADTVMVKLSPMLDISKMEDELKCVREIHVVGTNGECKELLVVMSRHDTDTHMQLFCFDDGETVSFWKDDLALSVSIADTLEEGMVLAEPSSCMMKTGAYGYMCKWLNAKAIAPNSHLFVGNNNCKPSRMFRSFTIKKITTMNKRELQQSLQGITHANISVRNFPLSAPELRKRLKLKDGGETYIFGTTDSRNQHLLLICEKIKS